MTDIKKLWDLMSKDEFGPEPIVIEVDEGEINVSTLSCQNESGQDGLYITGRGKTLEEAFRDFEIDLDTYLLDIRE